MPQLDVMTLSTQVLWFIGCFYIGYLMLVSLVLSRVGVVFKVRSAYLGRNGSLASVIFDQTGPDGQSDLPLYGLKLCKTPCKTRLAAHSVESAMMIEAILKSRT